MKSIDFKDNIVKRNKIPLLIYTPEWLQLFNNFKTKNLTKSAEKLEELINREKNCEAELREMEKRKKIVMNKILYLSNDINDNNNGAAIPKLEEAQKELLGINKRIPELLEEGETLPGLINTQNTELLKETIKRAYELINEHKSDSEKCQQEVNELRQKLGALIQKKVELDERVNKLYNFIHGMLGAADIDRFDERFMKDE